MPKQGGEAEWTTDDGSVRAATYQCVHCGKHFYMRPGSGVVRGYCMKCSGLICGPDCQSCVPYQQQLENMEAGRHILYMPIVG